MITLPHSANQKIPIEKFLAAWIIWVERFHNSTAWEGFHFPFDWQKETLAVLIGGGRLSGLDAMVRFRDGFSRAAGRRGWGCGRVKMS
jgi:hypothetical protein